MLAFAVVLAIGCAADDPSSSAPSAPRTSAAQTDQPAAPTGGWTKVGNLELRLIGVEQYDSAQHNQFNTANTRAELRVRKVGGDEYDFTLATFTLFDTSGVGYDHDFFCTGCPGMIDQTSLYDATAVTRYAYFDVPSLGRINRLRYEPFSLTTDPVIIPLP